MSHQRRRRPPVSDTDLRPGLGPRGLSERRGFNGSGSVSGMSSSPALSSPLGSGATDNALSILSSCGLEPADLALLAKLPEDALTEESLPHLVRQIKSNRGALKPPSSPKPPAGRRHQYPGRSVQYPLDHIKPTPLPAEQAHDRKDRWQNSRSFASVSQTRASGRDPPSQSSSSRYSVYAGPAFSGQDRRPGRAAATIPSLFSPPGPADRSFAAPAESRRRSESERGQSDPPAGQTLGQPAGATVPSEQEAHDFHGTEPRTYPASCSLCNACVISAKNWTEHINSARHADGQLGLLQRFPAWDCRKESLNRTNRQSEKRREDRQTLQSPQSTSGSRKSQAGKSAEKKVARRSKVVCVKFPAQSVDESYLRKLAEPFGTISRILTFPSLAFVEFDSAEQAQELVNSHNKCPPNVKGQRIDFSISNGFNSVKSSCVISFTPPAQSDDDKSDLLNVVKRFGLPVYTLFQKSKAYIEMKNLEDAKKLVDYYSSNILRINDKVLLVSFAPETSSLGTCALAQRYQEESPKRMSSRDDDDHTTNESKKRRGEDHRSKFQDRKSTSNYRERKTRSNSREKKTRSNSRDRKARSRSREKSSSSSAKLPETEKPETTGSSCGSAAAPLKPSEVDGVDREQSYMDAADSKEDDSDIEGMEVLGEDGEDLEEEDNLETLEEAEKEDDSPKPQAGEKMPQAWRKSLLVPIFKNKGDVQSCGGITLLSHTMKLWERVMEARLRTEVKKRRKTGRPMVASVTKNDIPPAAKQRSSRLRKWRVASCWMKWDRSRAVMEHLSRVVYFKDLPLSYCNGADFVKLTKGLGRPVRYYLLRGLQKGFLEMSRCSEAIRVINHLNVYFKNTQTAVLISNKYRRLVNGCAVHLDEHETELRQSGSSSRSNRHDESRIDEKDQSKTGRKDSSRSAQEKEESAPKTPEREDSIKKTQDKKSTSRNSSDILSVSKSNCRKTQDIESKSRKNPEIKSDKTLDIRSEGRNTSVSKPEGEKALEIKSDNEKTVENKQEGGKTLQTVSESGNTLENKPEGGKTPEIKLESDTTLDMRSEGRKTAQSKSKGRKALDIKSDNEKKLENKLEGRKTPETASEGGNNRNVKSKDMKTAENKSDGGKTLDNKPEGEKTPEIESKSIKTPEIKLKSEKTLDMRAEGRKTAQRKSESGNALDIKTRENKLEGGKTAEIASGGGNTHKVKLKDRKTPDNKSECGKILKIESSNGTTLEAASEGRKTLEDKSEGRKTLETVSESGKTVKIESEGSNTLENESEARKTRQSESEDRKTLQKESEATKTLESESEGRSSQKNESKSKETCKVKSEAGKTVKTQEKCGENLERECVSSKLSEEMSSKDPVRTDSRQEDPSPEDEFCEPLKRRASPVHTSVPGKIRKEEERGERSNESEKNQASLFVVVYFGGIDAF
ncbi:uncharacterized protein LOC133407362 isoform X1 [Phycodurus eques]|uniref:uncharacterized protein LOC133407362 isoform X1 n=1 Tax=Phycodurus eques TaxID=693459 RepID=UPI002ACDCD49|nr:uncharacterized protein LOC133407362 isoform X1 [Phycodurus eques]XP_061541145.1 uncharacterized protein LOC133407362 isoform X1 [Phycodurus eques]XP_061541146.1 uncharacterized protein LOC133407362 isoform X1 [Phycodurus eques]